MSEIDPRELKVADLRAQLKERGLDTKGKKAELVERLELCLEAELLGDMEDGEDGDADEVAIDEALADEEEADESVPEPVAAVVKSPAKKSTRQKESCS